MENLRQQRQQRQQSVRLVYNYLIINKIYIVIVVVKMLSSVVMCCRLLTWIYERQQKANMLSYPNINNGGNGLRLWQNVVVVDVVEPVFVPRLRHSYNPAVKKLPSHPLNQHILLIRIILNNIKDKFNKKGCILEVLNDQWLRCHAFLCVAFFIVLKQALALWLYRNSTINNQSAGRLATGSKGFLILIIMLNDYDHQMREFINFWHLLDAEFPQRAKDSLFRITTHLVLSYRDDVDHFNEDFDNVLMLHDLLSTMSNPLNEK